MWLSYVYVYMYTCIYVYMYIYIYMYICIWGETTHLNLLRLVDFSDNLSSGQVLDPHP